MDRLDDLRVDPPTRLAGERRVDVLCGQRDPRAHPVEARHARAEIRFAGRRARAPQ